MKRLTQCGLSLTFRGLKTFILAHWIERVERIRDKAIEVYVITNNHYRGQAVVNAFELQQAFREESPNPPEHLVKVYPRLAALTRKAAG